MCIVNGWKATHPSLPPAAAAQQKQLVSKVEQWKKLDQDRQASEAAAKKAAAKAKRAAWPAKIGDTTTEWLEGVLNLPERVHTQPPPQS